MVFLIQSLYLSKKKTDHQATSSQSTLTVASIAHKGKFSMALNSQKEKNNHWIIDFGASNHMKGNADLFHMYSLCSENSTVRIANGSIYKVVGIGSIVITEDLALKSVLLVPNLTYNLLSISKLTRDLNYVTNFYFKTWNLGGCLAMLGNVLDSIFLRFLIILKKTQVAYSAPFPISFHVSNNDSAIMLWHYRLGHQNLLYLKKLFPSLFNNSNAKFFQCEIC